tara:strand:+ start:33154 stop:33462 length:309 start_codon:yes stop_codon:yes gene_type:complete
MRRAVKLETGFSFVVHSFCVGNNDWEYYETDNGVVCIQTQEKSYWDFIQLPQEEMKIRVVGDDLQYVAPPQGCEWYNEEANNKRLSTSARLRILCRKDWEKE